MRYSITRNTFLSGLHSKLLAPDLKEATTAKDITYVLDASNLCIVQVTALSVQSESTECFLQILVISEQIHVRLGLFLKVYFATSTFEERSNAQLFECLLKDEKAHPFSGQRAPIAEKLAHADLLDGLSH